MSHRFNACPVPPGPLVTLSVNLAVMQAAYRHGELVAHLQTQCARLGKAEVVCVARTSAAQETGLARYEVAVLLVPQSGRFLRGQTALVGTLLDGYRLADRFGLGIRAFRQGIGF